MTYVKSDIDNKFYLVRGTHDRQQAANILAKIHKNIIYLSDHLMKEKEKYKDYIQYIELLHQKVRDIVLLESTRGDMYTSYSVNKGDKIIFCMRTKTKETNELHNFNLIMYVVLHEISHVACPIYDNHGPLFRKIFKFLIERASELGLYKRIDFAKTPVEYCGMMIYAE
jgi:hypothetical protein